MGDPRLRTFLRANGIRDVVESASGGGARVLTYRSRREGGGASRIDRVYVGSEDLARVCGAWGADREPVVFESDHGVVGSEIGVRGEVVAKGPRGRARAEERLCEGGWTVLSPKE